MTDKNSDIKIEIRKQMSEARKSASPDELGSSGRKIRERVMGLPEFADAKTVFCFLSMPGEPETSALLSAARDTGKKVCVPAFDKEMQMYRPACLQDGTVMQEGPDGIPEPANPEFMDWKKVDLIFVPGVAFDSTCRRLGRGRGHYDKILRHRRGEGGPVCAIGLAFDFQVMDTVPTDDGDEYVDLVVTETRTFSRSGTRKEGNQE